jgi:hypothetical protein
VKKILGLRKGLILGVLGGGMLFSNGCLNALLSIQICGVVVPATVCTPEDQLLLTFQFLEVPDFDIDPSCTIPNGCFRNDAFDDGSFPFGGDAPEMPQAGGGGGGGGGM